MFERFTEKAIKAVTIAQGEAIKGKLAQIHTEHLLIGVMSLDASTLARVFRAVKVDRDEIFATLEKSLETKPKVLQGTSTTFSERAKTVLARSWDISRSLGNNYISPEHIFLSLISNENAFIVELFDEYDIERIKNTLTRIIAKKSKPVKHPEGPIKAKQVDKKYYCASAILKEEALKATLNKAQEILCYCNYEALGTEQLLEAVLKDKESALTKTLNAKGVDLEKFQQEKRNRLLEYNQNELFLTPKAYNALVSAYETAKELGSSSILPEHIVLGILKNNNNLSVDILKGWGVDIKDLIDEIQSPIEKQRPVALSIIRLAKEEARRLGQKSVGTEFILLGILAEGGGIGAKVLSDLGVSTKDIRSEIQRTIGFGDEYQEREITFTTRAKKLLEIAWNLAKKNNRKRIESENLLFGITQLKDSVAMKVLENLGVDVLEIKHGIKNEMVKSG